MKKKLSLFGLLFGLLFSPLAFAHFHYDLPLQTTLKTNTKGELTGLNITWVYDDELTELMLKDQKNIDKLGKKLISDLHLLGYFTAVKLNGKPLNLAKVSDYNLQEIKRKDYKNLELTFSLPLKKSVSLAGKNTLSFRHEDANASAILYYDKPQHLQLGTLKNHCKVDITEKKSFEEGEAPQNVKVVCL